MSEKSRLLRFCYFARDLRSRALFTALREHCSGNVLDVGGSDFYGNAIRRGVRFDTWTILEPVDLPEVTEPRVRAVRGDGCAMEFPDSSFDTVLNIQVLEHVFEPIKMVTEIGRVLRPGGMAIFLIPQTSTTHLAPHYYGNFSRYWIKDALERAGLELLEHRPLGGFWSSMASHMVYFPVHALRRPGFSDAALKRPFAFYLLFPFMCLFALFALPVTLFLSLGDLEEEPNNHMVVARRRAPRPA
jgi:SAM-dependent methyltransferase